MASSITKIPNREVHDTVVAESVATPTIIYVSNSSLPACKAFTPKYEVLADKYEREANRKEPTIRFCQLEFTNETSMMFKFAPNQLPVTVLMCNDNWCKTILGANMAGLERAIEELLQKARR